MATTTYGSMTSNRIDRKNKGKRHSGGAKKATKIKK